MNTRIMKLTVMGCCLGFAAATVCGQQAGVPADQDEGNDDAKFPNRAKAIAIARDLLVDEGMPVYVVNKQSRLTADAADQVRGRIRDGVMCKAIIRNDASPLQRSPTAFAESYMRTERDGTNRLNVCVFLVDVAADEHPAMALSYDQGWVIVNVGALGKAPQSVLAERAAKYAVRGVATVFGAGFTLGLPSLMMPARTVAEIDKLNDSIDRDAFTVMGYWANQLGVVLAPAKPYRYKALRKGMIPPMSGKHWAHWQEQYKKDPAAEFRKLGVDPDAIMREEEQYRKEFEAMRARYLAEQQRLQKERDAREGVKQPEARPQEPNRPR